MSSETRWTVLVVVLVVGLVVALWPGRGAPQPSSTVTGSSSATAGRLQPSAVNDGALMLARRQAGLRPCPRPNRTQGAVAGPLAGVEVDCLGSPGSLNLGAALAGRTTLVNLWASWCAPCRGEIPVLQAYTQQPGAIDVVGVNVRDKSDSALALLTSLGARYPSVVDTTTAAEVALAGPPVLPLSFIVAADGTVQRVRDPGVFTSVAQVRSAVVAAS